MSKILELHFNASFGPAKITVRNPKDSLTPAEIKNAMQLMIQSDVFTSANGNLVSVKNARYVDRSTQEIELP